MEGSAVIERVKLARSASDLESAKAAEKVSGMTPPRHELDFM